MSKEPAPFVVRVVAPAGPVEAEDLDEGIRVLAERGFKVQEAPHTRHRLGYLAGPDSARLEDLQDALDDPGVDAVWFARGGYGTTRLLPLLSPERIPAKPKLLLGYSDATAFFAWSQAIESLTSFYAPSVQELGREGVCNLESVWAALECKPAPIPGSGPAAPSGPHPVVGGCLSILSVLAGTPWAPDLRGHWLFLEDVGEPLYRLDRMLTHLHQAGWLDAVEGLVLGSFRGLGPGETAADVAARARELLGPGKPLISGLPVGHVKGKHVLPLEEPALWNGSVLAFPSP